MVELAINADSGQVAVWAYPNDNDVRVDIRYPKRDAVPKIHVGLDDVRAADDITVTYDFERDGWSITREVHIPHDGEGWMEATGEWVEVAFIPAWTERRA